MTGSRWRGWAGLMLALALAAPSAAHSAPKRENCPGPYCTEYVLHCGNGGTYGCRWPADRDGITRIPYWINPEQPWMPEEDVIGAARAAERAWEMYNPKVRFMYQGTTDDPPKPMDGKLTVGFLPLLIGMGAVIITPRRLGDHDMDVVLRLERPWFWAPCHTRCGYAHQRSCADAGACPVTTMGEAADPTNPTGFDEIQGVLTHEFGHVLGLDHPDNAGLTMKVDNYEEQRRGMYLLEMSTLGLGDILGAKELYPWSCPKIKRGRSYPSAYRYVCPSIRVFSP